LPACLSGPRDRREDLATAFGVFVGFRYTDELDGDGIHGLLLEARIGDRSLQDIDLL